MSTCSRRGGGGDFASNDPCPTVTNGIHTKPVATASNVNSSVIADEMDVDNRTAEGVEADAAAEPAPVPTQSQMVPATSLFPVRTPEPQGAGGSHGNSNDIDGNDAGQARPLSPDALGTPGHLPPFDWDAFEARYEQALSDMNGEENDLQKEFETLVNYFNVWASSASAHDNERAVKRLQTRERYVRIAEQSLGQRKQHLTEVVRAFQSALALLSQT